MKTEVIRDWAGFSMLEGEWNELLARSASNTIFLRWEWLSSWVAVVKDSLQPLIIIVRDHEGKLAGAAPFYISELRLGKMIPYRALRMIADHAAGSEYTDWPARTGHEEEILRAIASGLVASRKYWDCLYMSSVAGWTGARERIEGVCIEAGFHVHVRPREFSGIGLPASMDAYTKSLSQNKRRQLRGEIRRFLDRESVSVTRCTSAEQLPRFLEALFDLHHRRRMLEGDPGCFRRKPNEARFYRQFTPIALDRGWLRLYALEDEGNIKAVQVGYVYEGVYHQLQEGFDPDNQAGSGNALRAAIIENLIGEGVGFYDFLGGMTEHKRRWGAKERYGHDIFVGNANVKNFPLFAAGIWPTGRYLRPVRLPSGRDHRDDS